MFDEVRILFHFNIILKHNGASCTKTYITNSVHLPNKSNSAHSQVFRNQTSLLASRQCTTRYKDADGDLPVFYDNVTQTYTSIQPTHPPPPPRPPKIQSNSSSQLPTSTFGGRKFIHPASPYPLSPQRTPSTNTSRHCWVKDLLLLPVFH